MIGGVKDLREMKRMNQALEKLRKQRVSSSPSEDSEMNDIIAELEGIRFAVPDVPARELIVKGPKMPIEKPKINEKALYKMKKSALFDALDDIAPSAPSMVHKRASERIRGNLINKAYNTNMMPMTPPALVRKSKASTRQSSTRQASTRPSQSTRPSNSSPMPLKVDIKPALISAFITNMNKRLAENMQYPAQAYANAISKVIVVPHIRTKQELKAVNLGKGNLYDMAKEMLKKADVQL